MSHTYDYDELAGVKKQYLDRFIPEDHGLVKLANLVANYLLSFSECKHGEKPSTCSMCRAIPHNTPEYQARLRAKIRWMLQNGIIVKSAPSAPAMLVDRRPERIEHNDRVLSDVRNYGSARERMKFKHEERDGLHKYYGYHEKIWNPKTRRYVSAYPHRITRIPQSAVK